MSSPARIFRKLEGLFAVYKPPGTHWKLVRDTIETNLLKGINAAPEPRPQLEVRFQALPSGETSEALTMTASHVPVLATSPHVLGPSFRALKVGVGHRLDAPSSGVLVIGVGQANKMLEVFYSSPVTRDYTLEGEFGMATDDFSDTGRIIERTTFDHITEEKLERILAVIQGGHQKALIMYSGVDLQSQEAYELAVRGKLHPDGKSPPILIGLRCIRFQPPHFTLEVRCVNETQRFLRKLVHEVGLELLSTAVCTGVRRTRDGPFGLQEALTRHHWTAPDIQLAIRAHHNVVKGLSKNVASRTETQNKRKAAEEEDCSTNNAQVLSEQQDPTSEGVTPNTVQT